MVFETEDLEDILIGIVVYCKRRKTWIGLGEVFFLSSFFFGYCLSYYLSWY